MRRPLAPFVALCGALLAACAHSDGYAPTVPIVGPATGAASVQLTFNVEQDYWPMWTQDGRGILYAFAAPGPTVRHRCVGLLPAAGGTRIWELCDNRATQDDSTGSFTGYALATDGRLLYASAVSDTSIGGHAPGSYTLWLADTATPFRRTALLKLPVTVSGVSYGWLTDIAWTGTDSFIALAQDFAITAQHQPPCDFAQDSVFLGAGAVVTGTITPAGATLQLVNGTTGATGYSLAEGGLSVVFIKVDDVRLFKVPIGGGAATSVSPIAGGAGNQLLGISCKASTCVVANDAVTLIARTPTAPCYSAGSGPKELDVISLTGGPAQRVFVSQGIVAVPRISPVAGDVVLQVGGSFGHLHTIRSPPDGNLFLLKALIP